MTGSSPSPVAEGWPYGVALELGAGTGFFSLNLKQAGVVDEVHVTDLSPGMVEAARANAARLGFSVEGRVADAERIPYDDNTFDVVVGHAVIHHLPDVEQAMREMLRVLKPGGRFVIAGEPTRIGDRYARALGRVTWKVATTVTSLPPLRDTWARPKEELDESSRAAALEAVVDLHTFDPDELARTALRAGAVDVGTTTEELTAAFLGWPVRTFEAAVRPGVLGWGWASFAFGSWKRLSALDRALGQGRAAALLLQRRCHRREADPDRPPRSWGSSGRSAGSSRTGRTAGTTCSATCGWPGRWRPPPA